MNKPRFGESIRNPYEGKKGRRFYLAFAIALTVYNIASIVRHIVDGSPFWWVNSILTALLVAVILFLIKAWDHSDAEWRASDSWEPPSTIAVTTPDDATSPFNYAMMRAFHGGEPVAIYRDDEGVWRDSATDEPTPVQEDKG